MMSFVKRNLFHSHLFCPFLLMERVTMGGTSILVQGNEVHVSVCVVYVFVLAKTRQEERTDGGKKEKGEQRGVCLYSEPV